MSSDLLTTPAVLDYVRQMSTAVDPHVAALIDRTFAERAETAGMAVTAHEAALLTLLARTRGTRRALEIGTYTGVGALALAQGVGPAGTVVTLDIDAGPQEALGRPAWRDAGVEDRIDARIGDAHDTLAALGDDERFGLVFLDADKAGYVDYYELALPHLEPDGILLADNVLWSGAAADEDADETGSLQAIRAFNAHVAADTRVDALMLPLADGITLVMPRSPHTR